MKSFAEWRNEFRIFTFLQSSLERVGEKILMLLRQTGEFILFAVVFLKWSFRPPFRPALLLKQMEFIGVKSLGIILLTGGFTGMVFALQSGYAFRLFNAQILVGSTVGLALTREIGPVFTALMVTARAGSAMAAELGTMKVTEQIEALETMAVNPIQYLVVPRVWAGTLMLPCLAAIFAFIGVIGAYFVAVTILNIPAIAFTRKLTYYVDANDFWGGLLKSAVFGFFLSLISCQRGFLTKGGAEGVGRSTTQAVVVSSVAVLIINYFITSLILEFFPEF